MKKLSKEQIEAKAKRIADAHKVTEVFATVDGEIFLQKNPADAHNKSIATVDFRPEVIPFDFKEKTVEKVDETLTATSTQENKGEGDVDFDPSKVIASEPLDINKIEKPQ